MDKPIKAFHGGAFFGAIGESLRTLDRANEVISADVLDAWYDPSPKVLAAISDYLPFLIKTSPPTHGDGLREVISQVRGVDVSQILLGAGTSSLMFLALQRLIKPGDRVLTLDPTYGEYAHIVENVIGADLVRFPLMPFTFDPNLDELIAACQKVDVAILVNPNSPTGRMIDIAGLTMLFERCPTTQFWIDETYIDFPSCVTGRCLSVEKCVSQFENIIVAKSMSKFYGLSGLRLGYLVANTKMVEEWERFSPPWSVGLIAQLAGIEALLDEEYYQLKAIETRILADDLIRGLEELEFQTTPTVANFVMACKTDQGAGELCRKMAEKSVFIRDANNLSPLFGDRWVRIAVKDATTQRRLLETLSSCL